jgi:starvation-inducible outer membrane lipoprotein
VSRVVAILTLAAALTGCATVPTKSHKTSRRSPKSIMLS